MKIVNLIPIIRNYRVGFIIAIIIIGFIHLYSYLFEPYFTYATFNNILVSASLSGIPFGIAIWAFSNLLKKQL